MDGVAGGRARLRDVRCRLLRDGADGASGERAQLARLRRLNLNTEGRSAQSYTEKTKSEISLVPGCARDDHLSEAHPGGNPHFVFLCALCASVLRSTLELKNRARSAHVGNPTPTRGSDARLAAPAHELGRRTVVQIGPMAFAGVDDLHAELAR